MRQNCGLDGGDCDRCERFLDAPPTSLDDGNVIEGVISGLFYTLLLALFAFCLLWH